MKPVFAHYFTPYPISLDNKTGTDYYDTGYLNPAGEGGKHLGYGGLLRDRPLRRPAITGDWELADMNTEVARAQACGLDGFTVDLLQMDTTPYNSFPADTATKNWRNARLVKKLLSAAQKNNFKIVLMPDMTAGGMKTATPAALASYIKMLGTYTSAYRLDDGRLVVSPFCAENWSVANWQAFIQAMGGSTKVALVPCFLNYGGFAASFAPISHGFSHWGNRSPATNALSSNIARINDAHAKGKIWMQPVSVQDVRPNQSIYDEAMNTLNLRYTFQAAIQGNAEWIQIITWNDFSENTHVCPSEAHGYGYWELCAYYSKWFKDGKAPAIADGQEKIYLTHRNHFYADKPTNQTLGAKLRSGSSPAQDTIEALVFASGPGNVTINAGTTSTAYSVVAGINSYIVPLVAGPISATYSKQVVTVDSHVQAVSPVTPTHTPATQDLSYIIKSS